MYLYTICVLLLLGAHHVGSIRFSHTITEDTTWYYQQLTTEPSLITEIQFSVVSIDYPHTFRLNFYTTEDNINLQKNCSSVKLMDSYSMDICGFLSGLTNNDCLKDKNGLLHCTGKTVIQDFKPRTISFSFGKSLWNPKRNFSEGPQLQHQLSLVREISRNVFQYKTDASLKRMWLKFYPFASFPNLLGQQQQEAIDTAGSLFLLWFKQMPGDCYKFQLEMLCYIFGPKCDVTRRVTIPPCRENCWDFVNGCLRIVTENRLTTVT